MTKWPPSRPPRGPRRRCLGALPPAGHRHLFLRRRRAHGRHRARLDPDGRRQRRLWRPGPPGAAAASTPGTGADGGRDHAAWRRCEGGILPLCTVIFCHYRVFATPQRGGTNRTLMYRDRKSHPQKIFIFINENGMRGNYTMDPSQNVSSPRPRPSSTTLSSPPPRSPS